jgi:DNA-binding IclR family transcriptional regulator
MTKRTAPMKERKLTSREIRRTVQELVEMGLLEDSGERRNGQIVWRLSALGMMVSEENPPELHAPAPDWPN